MHLKITSLGFDWPISLTLVLLDVVVGLMYHRRVKYSHRRSNAVPIGIPMINPHTPSKIARCSAEQPDEDLAFTAEEENIFPYFWYVQPRFEWCKLVAGTGR